jgi:hypothetical protein
MEVAFEDGTSGIVDMAPLLAHPAFKSLRDQSLFREARVDPKVGTVVWPNGLDIAPDALYEEITGGRRLGED